MISQNAVVSLPSLCVGYTIKELTIIRIGQRSIMSRTERLYRIEDLLNERKVVPLQTFLQELEISKATFKRDLEYLRDRLNAPIIWDRDAGGYRFDNPGVGNKFELPGLWFNASEIHALLTMQQLLRNLGQGLLTPHIEPLMARLRTLLDSENVPTEDIEQRIRIQSLQARGYEPEHFTPIATAVLKRRRLKIEHYSKFHDKHTEREISPQRLNHYRENWYVDAFCHLRNEIRSFSLDSIKSVKLTDLAVKEVSEKHLNKALDSGYGIYSGTDVQWAELAFTPERARWVSKETWHPEQESWFTDDGTYHLRVPYSDSRELCSDILRHVPEVYVVAPDTLQEQVTEILMAGINWLGKQV